MAFTEDEEILQDFLIEAGEILELLGEQLIDLENRPEDKDLLNAVFRGFHTIKGGASFLSLKDIVSVCHVSEDVFNLLRNGERQINTHLMDTVLLVLDVLNGQFVALNTGVDTEPADPSLISALELIVNSPEQIADDDKQNIESSPESSEESVKLEQGSTEGDITDEEFEMLLDTLDSSKKDNKGKSQETSKSENVVNSDEMSDGEFDALLDNLHGSGKPVTVTSTVNGSPEKSTQGTEKSGQISDDEFESLLDSLHGSSKPGEKTDSDEKTEVKKVVNLESKIDKLSNQSIEIKERPATVESVNEKVVKIQDQQPKEVKHQAETTLRVDTSRLDDIMNLVGELVLVRNRIATLEATRNDEELEKAVSTFDVVTSDLQAAVMKTRMQPIKKIFGRFPRVIRDLARSLNKKVNLELYGEDTDLDKNLVEALADPLVHLVRNSVDHGIELPDVRKKAGKPEHGTVTLGAKQEGDHISLTIEDDGAGMDPEKLRKLAVSKKMMDEDAASRLSAKECFNLIFMAGFSTKKEISDVSGRGVGMDVVKNSISQLNGVVDIDSEVGRGSKLTIKVPLTLAIMPTLMIRLQDQIFALPLVNVGEILNLDLTTTNIVDGQPVIMIRDKALPIFHLRKWLVANATADFTQKEGHVVIVSVGTQKVGFVVDQLVGQEEVVIKPLDSTLNGTRGLAGATITGDGKIALILDVPELMASYAGS